MCWRRAVADLILVRRMKKFIALFMLSGLSLGHADTCGDYSTTGIVSLNGNIAVRIDPGSPEESGKTRIECVATLMKWDREQKSYRFFRRVTLRNPIRPSTAVITNDARFLVTFDDYCERGKTSNAVVIYDLQQGTSHAYALKDFLPASYRETLQESVSSIYWRGNPRLDEWITPTIDVPSPNDSFVATIVIDLAKNTIKFEESAKLKK
jgi:hypothetical protein